MTVADDCRRDRPRGAIRLLVAPLFGGFFWGRLTATVGVFVHSIVAALVVYDATGSAVMVGLVSVVQFGPQLVLAPLSGTWADRGHAVRQIMIGRIVCVVGSGSMAAWSWLGPTLPGDVSALPVIVASFVVGLGFVIGGPAMNSVVPRLIRPGETVTAMALNSAPSTVARMAGPALGAFVAAHLGAAAGFGVAAAMHLVFVVILVLLNVPSGPPHRPGVDYSVRAALRHVWRDRPLLVMLAATVAVGFAAEPSITLAPALAEELGGGPVLVGQLSAAFGIGAALGLVGMAWVGPLLRSALVTSAALWLMTAGLLMLVVPPGLVLALAGFAVTGLGFSCCLTGATTLIQERVPEELRGRVMALWMMAFVGSRPVAAAMIGFASDVITLSAGFAVTAVVVAVVAAWGRPSALTGVDKPVSRESNF
jgi:MFS family permease